MIQPVSMILPGGYLKNTKKIAIRVDASSQIGTGHFMRCLTLADAWKLQGAQIRFVSCELPEYLHGMLVTRGIELASLCRKTSGMLEGDLAHSRWLYSSQEQDAQATIHALSDWHCDWIVVDHYALDARWENMLRAIAKQIMVVDDIADRQHDCDVLLDQNFYADMQTRYNGKVPVHCQLLLGPRYALLREEFDRLRNQVMPRKGSVNKILVFFGGVDANNYTSLAIQALGGFTNKEIQVDIVIGAQHPYQSEIETMCLTNGYICHVQTTRMAELMAKADLAIGAAGAANWERCCMGLPCIVGAVAQNQIQAAKDLSVFGAVTYIGVMDEITVERLKQGIEQASRQEWLNKASALGLGLVDSKGVWRVIDILEKK